MKVKRILFLFRLNLSAIQHMGLFLAEALILFASLASLFVLIYQFGFDQAPTLQTQFNSYHAYILLSFFVGITLRYGVKFSDTVQERMLYVDLSIYLLLFSVLSAQVFFKEAIAQSLPFLEFLRHRWFCYALMAILSAIHLSRLLFGLMQSRIRPALLFSFSFLLVILIGTGLLMLPNATRHGIGFIDALFTATTSVCVTGLTTVNPAITFTPTGYMIILLLIQIGGIGVMTFTSFLALSFMGKSSFNSQLMLQDVLNEDRLSGLFRVVMSILFVTLLIEGVGAYFIYMQVRDTLPGGLGGDLFFAIFHAVSAFCNAGISTLSGNLGDPLVADNYALHVGVALLVVVGGLGFPIVFNYMKLIQHLLRNGINIVLGKQKGYIHRPHIININTYVVVLVTAVLLVAGTAFYYVAEAHHTLQGMPLAGKLSTSFFGAVTPRTAGFSVVDMGALSAPTLLMFFALMLIGASPMSTGGGMKTTVVFVALFTMWNVMRGKTRLDLFGREIKERNIARAFTIIMLYLLWLFVATLVLSFSENEVAVFPLCFEVASALSTVGLSLNLTPHLSDTGKVVIILSMFIGRIGVLTFFSGLFRRMPEKNYSYPQESIMM